MSVLDAHREWIASLGVPVEALETEVSDGMAVTEGFFVDINEDDDTLARSMRAERAALQMLMQQSPAVLSLRETFNMLYYALQKARLQNDEDAVQGIDTVIFSAYSQVFPLILARLTPGERTELDAEAGSANEDVTSYMAHYLDRMLVEEWEQN